MGVWANCLRNIKDTSVGGTQWDAEEIKCEGWALGHSSIYLEVMEIRKEIVE